MSNHHLLSRAGSNLAQRQALANGLAWIYERCRLSDILIFISPSAFCKKGIFGHVPQISFSFCEVVFSC